MTIDHTPPPPGEFEGIFEPHSGSRPVMSKPPRTTASIAFVREVRDMLEQTEGVATDIADWIADKMERFGARTAAPIFTMDGCGPVCSWCGSIWPLCGHHHDSEVLDDGGEPVVGPTIADASTLHTGGADQ